MKKCFRILTVVLVFIAAMGGFTACDTYDAFYDAFVDKSEETYETVKIGVFQPLSGKDEEFGELEKMGIELAREVLPKCLGKDVELIYADNKSDIYVAETAIQELISKKPALILGSYGSVYSLTAAGYIEEAQIPAIAITNTNPLVTSKNPFYFRVCFVDSYQGVALAKYAAEEMELPKVGIMRARQDDVAAALSQSFEDKFVQMTGDPAAVSITVEYSEEAEDYSAALERIKESNVKAVLLTAPARKAAQIIKQAKEMEINTVFLGTEEWAVDEFIKLLGDAASMAVFSTVYDTEISVNSTTEVFLSAYREKYGEDAVPQPAVALAFDAYMIAVESINRACTVRDGDLLRESLTCTFQYPGASGNITFDQSGDPMKSVVIKGVRRGEFHNIYTMEPIFV